MKKFLIPMPEYNRIHQVIHGVIKDEGIPGKACTFFAIIGSLILNKHYGIPSRAVAGGFAMCVEPEKNLFYGRDNDGKIEFDEAGFHMWVQTETHIIDFMAPIYQESFAEVQSGTIIPRKMFQKPTTEEAQSIDSLRKSGEFITFPDLQLSEKLIDHILNMPLNTDFINIADHWFGKRRSKQRAAMKIRSNDGIVRNLTLPNTLARGAW